MDGYGKKETVTDIKTEWLRGKEGGESMGKNEDGSKKKDRDWRQRKGHLIFVLSLQWVEIHTSLN